MLYNYFVLLLFTAFEGAYSELKHPECRIIHDKYSYNGIGSRNLLSGRVWPNNTVPYLLGPGFNDKDLDIIKSAMEQIENKTCVRWIPRTNEKNYAYVQNTYRGCYANLGYSQYRGKHTINLQKYDGFSTCMVVGTAVHEMLHILGYAHEQTRPDRDNYVKIHWDRIERDSIQNYFKFIYDNATVIPPRCLPWSNATTFDDCYSGDTTDTFGYDYDYGSVMHYGLYYFQKTHENTMDTLQPVAPGIEIGQRVEMTELDALKIRAKYKCDPRPIIPTIAPTTVTTNKPEIVCKDKLSSCQSISGWCFLDSAKRNCPKTCKQCSDKTISTTMTTPPITTTSDCVDKYVSCEKFSSHCSDDIIWDNCPKTCQLCSGQKITTTPFKITTKNPDKNCQDEIDDCKGNEMFCFLASMKENCKATCGLCH